MSGSRHQLVLGVLLCATAVAAPEQKDRSKRPPKEEAKVVAKEKKRENPKKPPAKDKPKKKGKPNLL